ncbi:RidA family protein [Ancylobacter lacus]|uniref:RidA family protein n=1 Tax=Ancylobacter lacus TaxID=2579970 RepID=UPI001BD018DD|nr:RidA family protein [Ancylobacter lacus]MBS7539702.1 RidA family protein [Ancylobacter lacus]
MPRTTLQPPELFDSRPWGFSQVSISPPGRIVHIAGQVAWDAAGRVSAEGREAQLRRVLHQVIHAVTAAGGSADDIQMLRLYMPAFQPGTEADLVARVLTETFGTENPPSSTWLGVQALAQPDYLVEVDAVAVIP